MNDKKKTKGLLEQELTNSLDRTAQLEESIKGYLQSEKQFRDFVEDAPVGIYRSNFKGDILYANRALMAMFEFNSPQELISQGVVARYKNRKDRERLIQIVKERGSVDNFEVEVVTKIGKTKCAILSAVPEGDMIWGMMIDITERKQAEAALHEETVRNELILKTTMHGFFITDMEGKILKANPAAALITGFLQDELIGMHVLDLDPLLSLESFQGHRKLSMKIGCHRFETKCRRKDGCIIDVEVSQNFLDTGRQKGFFSFFTDITQRKQAEKTLREREKELETKRSSLEEVNVALKVLLKRRDEDKADLEEKVMVNLKELIGPYLLKLRESGLNAKQRAYFDVLESNINSIISPFARSLGSKYLGLTPKEILVANLIRQGKTTKQIAELWNISRRTVESHRENMRRKLRLKKQKKNLRSYLLSLK